jgi:hypothetical protein
MFFRKIQENQGKFIVSHPPIPPPPVANAIDGEGRKI